MIRIRPIIPSRNILDVPKIMDAIDAAMADEAGESVKDLQSATASWTNQPDFTITVKASGYSRDVSTDSEIFGYVDQGTQPHEIVARRARVLRFGTPYGAKTTPGRLGSGSGSRGDTMVYRKRVRHPGSKARGFSELASKLSQDRIRKRMEKLFQDVARGAG